MAKKEEGGARGFGPASPPSRARLASSTQLSPPPPLPSLPSEPRRTLVGVTDEAPGGWLAPPSQPPPRVPHPPGSGSRSLPRITSPSITYKADARAMATVDDAWDDDREDEVTHLYGVTDVGEEDDPLHDEKTRELPSPEDDKTNEIPRLPASRPAARAAPSQPSVHSDVTVVELTTPRESRPARRSRPATPSPPLAAQPPVERAPARQVEFPGPVRRSPHAAIPARLANPPSNPPPLRAPAPAPREHASSRVGPTMPPMGATPSAWAQRASSPDFAAPPVRAKQITATHERPRGPVPWRAALAVPVAGALVALGFTLMPGQGRILVNVKDARGGPVNGIEVFVDGEKASCTTAPCYLTCEPGAHEVKVMGHGFEVPASQAVAVRAGDSAAVQFTLSTGGGSGFKVGGSQPGVKLFVDGKEMGPLPQILRDLVPGDHVIRVAGSQRYQPIDRHVIVEPDKIQDIGSIALKVVKGYVTVNPGTPGARVYMVSGGDRRELTMLPISLDIDTGTSWSLEATKAGFEDYRQAIAFEDGLAEKTYTVTLGPKGEATGPSAAATTTTAPQPPPPPAPAPVVAPPPPPPAVTSGGGEAYLNINSIPPSTCVLDGKPLGSTPKLHVVVRSGTHRVTFRSADGATKTVTVTVGAGETRLAATRLED